MEMWMEQLEKRLEVLENNVEAVKIALEKTSNKSINEILTEVKNERKSKARKGVFTE